MHANDVQGHQRAAPPCQPVHVSSTGELLLSWPIFVVTTDAVRRPFASKSLDAVAYRTNLPKCVVSQSCGITRMSTRRFRYTKNNSRKPATLGLKAFVEAAMLHSATAVRFYEILSSGMKNTGRRHGKLLLTKRLGSGEDGRSC